MVEKLDKSLFVFSKKQIIVPSAGITEFYTIKLRYPIVDDSVSVIMTIHARANDDDRNMASCAASTDERYSQGIHGSAASAMEPATPTPGAGSLNGDLQLPQ